MGGKARKGMERIGMDLKPGNFRNDPYGYATNQAGHAMIGLALSTLLFPWWGIPSAIIVGLCYLLIWEGLVQGFVLPVDSFEDSVHVTTGGGIIVTALSYGWWGLMAILGAWAVLLAVGVWRRQT
jgi:hypothetical protein